MIDALHEVARDAEVTPAAAALAWVGARPARILLADDHALVRSGLRMIVDAEPDLQVVAEAGDVAFRYACELGLDGIVSKRLGSSYRSGRSHDWIETKTRRLR